MTKRIEQTNDLNIEQTVGFRTQKKASCNIIESLTAMTNF